MFRIISVLFLLLVLMVGISFSSLNAGNVELNYYFGVQTIPLAQALVAAVAIGAGLGILGSLSLILKLKAQVLTLNKKLKSSQSEVSTLKVSSAKER